MKQLKSYVLKEWISALAVTYFIMASWLTMEDIYKHFYGFIKSGATGLSLIKYCVWVIFSVSHSVLPIIIFIATLFALGKLHQHNEIIAIKSLGISLLEVSSPLIYATVFLALLNLALEASIIPIFSEKITKFRIQCGAKTGHNTKLRRIGFFNHKDNRLWMLSDLDELSYEASCVTIFSHDADNSDKWRLYADSGRFINGHWVFTNGNIVKFDKSEQSTQNVEIFSEKEMFLLSEPPEVMLTSLKKTKYLSLKDTTKLMKYFGNSSTAKPVLVKFHKIFSNAVNCLPVLLLAITFSVSKIRTNPWSNIGKVVGIVLLLIFLGTILTTLGNNGLIHPAIAVWAVPLIAIFPIVKQYKTSV